MKINSSLYKLKLHEATECLQRSNLYLQSQGPATLRQEAAPITINSSTVQKGSIYIAFKGTGADGHDFIPQAIKNGACCILYDDPNFQPHDLKTLWIKVKNSRSAWSHLMALACKNPQEKLSLIGVTGTNGKTSSVWLTSALLQVHGISTLSIGTLGAFYWGKERLQVSEGIHTTPDPDMLFPLLAWAVEKKISAVIMEVSSHSLIQEKLGPILFHMCAFTSFSRDHLDFHSNMDDYLQAKWRLFQGYLKPDSCAILNTQVLSFLSLDQLSSLNSTQLWAYGIPIPPDHSHSRYSLSNFHTLWLNLNHCQQTLRHSHIEFKVSDHIYEGTIPYFGDYTLENFSLAWIIATRFKPEIATHSSWMQLPQIPGRLERISKHHGSTDAENQNSPTVFVDFAHTPDGLEKVLQNLKALAPASSKIWVVFGCGGNRDRGKRPLMGKVAKTFADHLVLTSDNPRGEEPDAILQDIKSDITPDGSLQTSEDSKSISEYLDREEAIKFAITNASKKDIILIAGKGHEQYQLIGTKKIPFCDQLIAQKYL